MLDKLRVNKHLLFVFQANGLRVLGSWVARRDGVHKLTYSQMLGQVFGSTIKRPMNTYTVSWDTRVVARYFTTVECNDAFVLLMSR